MNKTFISALSDSRSSQFHQLARQVEKILLTTIQINIANAVAVQVTSFSSGSNGTSITAVVIISVIDIKVSSSIQKQLINFAISSGISNGNLTALNVSPTYTIPYITG